MLSPALGCPFGSNFFDLPKWADIKAEAESQRQVSMVSVVSAELWRPG